jgi:hypothetical protein
LAENERDSGYARESAEGFDHGVSVEDGRKSEEIATTRAQHSENRQQVEQQRNLLVIGLLEHGMERLGERVLARVAQHGRYHTDGVGDRGASDARRDILAVIRLSAPVLCATW